MRTIKEILEIMLENKHLFGSGLCNWNAMMYDNKKISHAEYRELRDYIKKNKPITWYNLLGDNANAYYWKPRDINPRIRWIEKHIKKNK